MKLQVGILKPQDAQRGDAESGLEMALALLAEVPWPTFSSVEGFEGLRFRAVRV